MKKNITILTIIFLTLLIFSIFVSCNDPIFWTIAQEVKPVKPMIEGTPTNFATFGGYLYVASGMDLYRYHGTSGWLKPGTTYAIEQPGGKIIALASTRSYLYALCHNDINMNDKAVIKRFNGSNWETLGGGLLDEYFYIHFIYSPDPNEDILFIGAANHYLLLEIYNSILFIKGAGPVEGLFHTFDFAISGAAYDGTYYYLSTRGAGVFKINPYDFSYKSLTVTDQSGNELAGHTDFISIINLQDNNNTIFSITREGNAFTVNKENDTLVFKRSMGTWRVSNAITIWRESSEADARRLVVVGRQDSLTYTFDSGYSYGYMELEFNENGEFLNTFNEPGLRDPSTLPDNARFHSTIGKYPVNAIIQTPSHIDSNMTMFASSQKDGIMSLRTHGQGFIHWNSEPER